MNSSDHPASFSLNLPDGHHHPCYPSSHCICPLPQASCTDTSRDSISSRTLSNPHSDGSPRSVIRHIHSSTSSAHSPDLSHPTCYHVSSVNASSSSTPLQHHQGDNPPIASPTCPAFHHVNQGTVLLVNNHWPALYHNYQHHYHHLQPWSLCAPMVLHHHHYDVDSSTEKQQICNLNHGNQIEYAERTGRSTSCQKAGSKSAEFARLGEPSRLGSSCQSGMLENPHLQLYSNHKSHEIASIKGRTTYPMTQRRSLDHSWMNMERNIAHASEYARSYMSSRSASTSQLLKGPVQRNSNSHRLPPKSPQAQIEDVDEFAHHMHPSAPHLSSKWEDAEKWVTHASDLNSTNRVGTMLRNSGSSMKGRLVNDVPITSPESKEVRGHHNECRSANEDPFKTIATNSTISTNFFDGRLYISNPTCSGLEASPSTAHIKGHPVEHRDEPNVSQNRPTEQLRKDYENQDPGSRRQPNAPSPHPALQYDEEIKASIKRAVSVNPRTHHTDRCGGDKVTQLVLEKFGDIDNMHTTKDQALIMQRFLVPSVTLKEAGTQMSSIDGSGSISRDASKSGSPQKWTTPSSYSTPARMISLHAFSDMDIVKGKEKCVSHWEELAQCHRVKLELQALSHGDHMQSFHRTTSNWSSRELEEADLSRSLRHSMDLNSDGICTPTRSHAWDSEDESKLTKLQLKEARIQAWEEKQKKKADAQLKRLEERLAKQRSLTTNKILGSLAVAQRKAEEMRASVHAQHNKTSKRGQTICHSRLSPLSHCTCLSSMHD